MVILKAYTNLKTLAQIGAEKSVIDILSERKKNGQIMRLISNMWLILYYTVVRKWFLYGSTLRNGGCKDTKFIRKNMTKARNIKIVTHENE